MGKVGRIGSSRNLRIHNGKVNQTPQQMDRGSKVSKNALAVRAEIQLSSFSDMMKFADVMCRSGAFPGEAPEMAVVKIQCGAELGIAPVAALRSIYIVKGKTQLGASLIGALIQKDPHYSYRITTHTDEKCAIDFFEDGERIGDSVFTMQNAKTAGLTSNQHYTKNPRNMLFARAMSNGQKWHCPSVTHGLPVYTEDEIESVEITATVEKSSNEEALMTDLGVTIEADSFAVDEDTGEVKKETPEEMCTQSEAKEIKHLMDRHDGMGLPQLQAIVGREFSAFSELTAIEAGDIIASLGESVGDGDG